MVYYVECGTDFLCEYGDMDEPYYLSLESVFASALALMKLFDEKEMQDFIQRLCRILEKASQMGWGYYDVLSDKFYQAYGHLT
jgi:hypothetical protein